MHKIGAMRVVGMDQKTRKPKDRPELVFTVDSENFPLREHDLTAGDILGYAGKDFGTHYLVELVGRGGQQREYRQASDAVKVHPGSRFLTVSTGPTPVT